jgi:hypothetical protein
MSDDSIPKPTDPKAELEQRIVQRAMAPYEPWLDDAERDGLRLFLDLFVTTHPAMRRMVDRRIAEEAGLPPPGTRGGTAPIVDRSTVVPKKRDAGTAPTTGTTPTAGTTPTTGTTPTGRTAPESSGVAAKQTTSRRPKRGIGGDK